MASLLQTRQNSPLLELPVELLLRTAEYLPRTDLSSLRAASKDLTACLTKLLARYFWRLDVLINNEESMGMLIDICCHPVFSKHVRVIKFDLARLKYVAPPECRNLGRYSGSRVPHTREQRAQQRDRQRAYVAARHEEEKFRRAADLESLTTALRSLAMSNRGLTCAAIEIGESMKAGYSMKSVGRRKSVPRREVHALGSQKLRRQLGYQDCLEVPTYNRYEQRHYEIFMKAVMRARYPFRSLALGSQDHPLDPYTLLDAFDEEHPPFRFLTHLDLVVKGTGERYSWQTDEEAEKKHQAELCFIMWTIAQASQLVSLKLRSLRRAGTWDINCFQYTVNSTFEGFLPPLHAICELELDGHDIEKGLLLRFVDSRSKTLRKLTLRDITDDDERHPEIKSDIHKAYGKDGLQLKLERVY